MEHAPRFDDHGADPTGLKTKLAQYANATFASLLPNSGMENKITLGKHTLDCPADMFNAWYTDQNTGRHNGVHFHGDHGIYKQCSNYHLKYSPLPVKTEPIH